MNKDRRRCKRIPTSLNVEVYHNDNRVILCRAKDISYRDICLFSGPLAFPKTTRLKLKLLEDDMDDTDFIYATVVRNTIREMALIFDPFNLDVINLVLSLNKQSNNRIYVAHHSVAL